MSFFLLGLGGKARAGKDTVANYLQLNYGFRVFGMSDALNDALEKLDPLIEAKTPITLPDGAALTQRTMRYRTLVDLVGRDRAKNIPEVRRLLQTLGTDVVRKMVDEEAWTRLARERIEHLANTGYDRVAVTGIRFENELEMIHAFENQIGNETATSLFIDRDAPDVTRAMTQATSSHVSEHALLAGDFAGRIKNDADLGSLYAKVDALMTSFGVFPLSEESSTLQPSTIRTNVRINTATAATDSPNDEGTKTKC